MAYSNKEDEREYQRDWYARNSEVTKARAKVSRKRAKERNKAFVKTLKESTPCADCGGSYPAPVMEFDHTGDDKEHDIARMANSSFSLRRIKDEIAKCELVCANCHRLRTHARSLSSVGRAAG